LLFKKKKEEEPKREEPMVQQAPYIITGVQDIDLAKFYIEPDVEDPKIRQISSEFSPIVRDKDGKLGFLTPELATQHRYINRALIELKAISKGFLTWSDVEAILAAEKLGDSAISRGIAGHERARLAMHSTAQFSPTQMQPQQRGIKGLINKAVSTLREEEQE
jgi:hypothetical protein